MTNECERELLLMRELAAGKCAVNKVIEELGPLSLWSKNAFEREILKAKTDEREACAKMVDHILKEGGGTWGDAIRKRPNVKLTGSALLRSPG